MVNYAHLLNSHDLKATFQRTQILEVIEKYGHTAIDKIYEEVSKVHSSLSLATIYKNIILMVESGVLAEVSIIGSKSKYEIIKDDHIHLICTECGIVIDKILDENTAKDTAKVAEGSSFSLKHRQVNLYGVCDSCQK
ncbi:MAG: transcriptional repressor [Sulfurovum sp.]|nr:transcriptional repressor [Sulfurovum sp.]